MFTEQREPDGYDDAVAYLTAHPEWIIAAWREPEDWDDDRIIQSHCLFQYAASDGSDSSCGCLTQIRQDPDMFGSESVDLALEIAADERIPDSEKKITVAALPVFAEWQRRIDRELGRTPPVRMAKS